MFLISSIQRIKLNLFTELMKKKEFSKEGGRNEFSGKYTPLWHQ